jgi:hypothetical protein
MVLDGRRATALRRLTEAVHAENALACAQIGHAGLVANTRSNRGPTLAPSTRLSAPAIALVRGATAAQLDEVIDDFGAAARNAVDAGFDAIEVHLGHGYLVSSFFSPNLNKRNDRFGGDMERRAELARRVVERVRHDAGDDVAVTAKFNMDDGVRGGFWLNDSLPTARLLESDGHLDALELTSGSSLLNPMYYFRGDVPMAEFIASQPTVVGLSLSGHRASPWLGHSCENPASSTSFTRGPTARACACTAPSAWRRSTPARGACCEHDGRRHLARRVTLGGSRHWDARCPATALNDLVQLGLCTAAAKAVRVSVTPQPVTPPASRPRRTP